MTSEVFVEGLESDKKQLDSNCLKEIGVVYVSE